MVVIYPDLINTHFSPTTVYRQSVINRYVNKEMHEFSVNNAIDCAGMLDIVLSSLELPSIYSMLTPSHQSAFPLMKKDN